MGDNRDDSRDGRYWAETDRHLLGKAEGVFLS
jgi:hypothetical protein